MDKFLILYFIFTLPSPSGPMNIFISTACSFLTFMTLPSLIFHFTLQRGHFCVSQVIDLSSKSYSTISVFQIQYLHSLIARSSILVFNFVSFSSPVILTGIIFCSLFFSWYLSFHNYFTCLSSNQVKIWFLQHQSCKLSQFHKSCAI